MTTTICVECKSEIPAVNGPCPECGFQPEELADAVAETPAETPAAPPEQPAPAEIAPEEEVVTAASVKPEKKVVIEKLEAGPEITNQVLQAQIKSFNELSAMIGNMIDNDNGGTTSELVASIRKFVDSAENTNNDMLSDLITNISRFVESSEKIKDDMINTMKDQNLITTSSMQEIVTSFSGEVKTATAGMQEAQKTALAEMNGVVQQVKAAASTNGGSGRSDSSPYVLYICLILTVFSILNFFVTAYVLRLVR